MPLEPFVEDLESVTEALRSHYVETDGGYLLDVDVDKHPKTQGLRNAYIQEQNKRKQARAELAKFEGVDLDKWSTLAELSDEELTAFQSWRDNKDDRLPPDGKPNEDFETRLERATAKLRADHKKEVEARDAKLREVEEARERLTTDLRNFKINQALIEVASKKGARDPQDILLRAANVWRMDEDGEPAAFDADGDIIRGHDSIKKMTMDEWIDTVAKTHPYLFKESVGGGTNGTGASAGARVRSKAELATVDQKVAFIREYGQEAFEDLPATSGGQ